MSVATEEEFWVWRAAKPLRYTASDGSIVDAKPGDIVPADEWGHACESLMERGKIVRVLAPDIEEVLSQAARHNLEVKERRERPPGMPSKEDLARRAAGEFPVHIGGGWWELSDGRTVKGKSQAEKAQAGLKEPSSSETDASLTEE